MKYRFMFCLLFQLLLFFPVTSAGEPIQVSRLSLNEGLSQSTVYAITQDREGYIWFATADGIDIFDGYEFKRLRHDPDDPGSLSDNYTKSLLEDKNGEIWIGTMGGGLNRYNKEQGTIIHYKHVSGDASTIPGNDIHALYESRDGSVWVGTNHGVARLPPSNAVIENLIHDPGNPHSLAPGIVRTIVQTADGDMWFGTAKNGLSRYNIATKQFTHYTREPDNANSISDNAINALLQDKNGTLWIGTEFGGLNELNLETGQCKTHTKMTGQANTINDSEVTSILEDASGRLWLGTWSGGINVYNPQNGHFTSHRASLANPESLSSDTIISLYEDRSGMLWAGSFDNGANRFPLYGNDFDHFVYDPVLDSGPPGSTVWSFAEDKNQNIFVGTKTGFNQFDTAANKFVKPWLPKTIRHIASADIRALLIDNDWLWIGTDGLGLYQYHFGTNEYNIYSSHQNAPNSLSNNSVRLIMKDSDGLFWLGTSSGLNRLNPDTGRIKIFAADATNPNALPHSRIRSLYQDHNGIIWIGTGGGLSRYRPETQDFVTIPLFGDQPENDSNSIYRDSEDVLWIATGKGLVRYDPQKEHVRVFTTRDGLVNNSLYGIVPDRNYLWITTNNGLSRFDKNAFTFKNFKVTEGLQSNEFNFNAYFKSSTGAIYIGGVNGYNRFYPEKIGSNLSKPQLSLQIKLHDRNERILFPQLDNGVFHVDHDIRKVEFLTTVLHFLRPETNRYLYKLEGYDRDWIEMPGNQKKVEYSGLPAGKYHFSVKGQASNGVWGDQIVDRSFVITTSPWLSWQACAAYLLLILALIYTLHKWRTQVLLGRAALLENQVKERTMEVSEQKAILERQSECLEELLTYKNDFYTRISHELRTPLSLILVPVELLIKNNTPGKPLQYLEIIKKNALRMQRLTDRILESASSDEVATPGEQTIDLSTSLQPILDSFSVHAEHFGISFNVEPYRQAAVTLEKEVFEDIFFNLLSNSVKYTNAGGEVSVSIALQSDCMDICVTDTGIGIAPGAQKQIFEPHFRHEAAKNMTSDGKGLGLFGLKQQLDRCGGRIVLHSEEGVGTTVNVQLPCRLKISNEVSSNTQLTAISTTENESKGESAEKETNSILVIEDDKDLQLILAELFTDSYNVKTAASAEQAFELLNDYFPDLILCDVMLPGRSGFDVVNKVKTDENLSYIPVLLVTALVDLDSRKEGLQHYADDYITKPFAPEELVLKVRNHLEQRKRLSRFLRKKYVTHESEFADTGVSKNQIQSEAIKVSKKDKTYLSGLEKNTRQLIDHGRLSQEALAREMSQSIRTMQRRIQALLNCTYIEYVQDIRISIAKERLEKGYSVKEVAVQAGFNSTATFRNAFKKKTGTSPARWGKQSKS